MLSNTMKGESRRHIIGACDRKIGLQSDTERRYSIQRNKRFNGTGNISEWSDTHSERRYP